MDELAERRERLFAQARASSALFFNGEKSGGQSASFEYFSGCSVDYSYLLLKKKGGVIFTNGMNLRQAKKESFYPVKLLGKEWARLLRKEAGAGRVGIEMEGITAGRHAALRKKAKLKLVDIGGTVHRVRGRKSASEVAALAESAKIARKILEELDPWECRTEKELSDSLRIKALEKGCDISFDPIVATGKNSSLPHHTPTNRKLENFVLVDFGVKCNGYCSDFTRCYFRKRGMKEREAYGKCIAVFEGMMEGIHNCRNGKDVALLSETLVKKNGLPRMIHSIGHGVGLEVHEYPHFWARSNDSLEGAVMAIEPAAYFKSFGVRFEEMMVNGKKGWKKL